MTVMTEVVSWNEGKEFTVFIWGLEHSWGRGVYSVCCTVNKRNSIAWLGWGICKVRGTGPGEILTGGGVLKLIYC